MSGKQSPSTHRKRNALVLAVLGVLWLVLDQLSKTLIDGSHAVGEHVAGPFLGIFQFTLVHNTGMAWGMLEDSTFALGLLSVAVCAVMALYLLAFEPQANLAEAFGGTLVVAGGLGNAIDRFSLGYVVDFIEPVFIEFPVFNVADIGVTCGFVLFLIGFVVREWTTDPVGVDGEDDGDAIEAEGQR